MPSAIDTARDVEDKGSSSALPTPLDTLETSVWDVDGVEDIERPPVSPITPTSSLARLDQSSSFQPYPVAPPAEPNFIQRPQSLPIDEADNLDVIALKSTLSTLELQKQKARRDMLRLKQLRDTAVDAPEKFLDDVKSGTITREVRPSDALTAVLEGNGGDDEDDDDDEAEHGSDEAAQKAPTSTVPIPQDIVRCPPINWEKYHVIGEPLDRMHEDQRKKPEPGQPWSEAREAVIAAPYDPLKDKLTSQPRPSQQLPPAMQTRRSANREKSGD